MNWLPADLTGLLVLAILLFGVGRCLVLIRRDRRRPARRPVAPLLELDLVAAARRRRRRSAA